MPLPQLYRVRWAVRATLALGVAASVVANVLHARPNPISQTIAAWPPLALLLTVELISRVPVHSRWLAVARFAATTAIAGIAAWVSYWHMAGVASRYGETGASPYLLPVSVDGLIVVASICLVELGGRISAAQSAREQAAAQPTARDRSGPGPAARKATKSAGNTRTAAAAGVGTASGTANDMANGSPNRSANGSANGSAAARSAGTVNGTGAAVPAPRAARPRRSVAETAALAAEIEANRPDATDADVASALGISTSRLRAVRKQVRDLEPVA